MRMKTKQSNVLVPEHALCPELPRQGNDIADFSLAQRKGACRGVTENSSSNAQNVGGLGTGAMGNPVR
jgi:hypothetical protein